MKRYILILLVLSISFWTQAQQKSHQYAIKSGYVEYKLEGSTTGTKKIWWDNFGEKSKTEIKSETTTKIFGMKNVEQSHTIDLLIKDKYWTADLKENTGYKGTLAYYKASKTYVESMSQKEQEEFANQLITSLGGEKLQNETVKGYNCEVMTVMGTKIWIHKGVTIKSEAKILGMESQEMAVKLDFNTSISGTIFTPLSKIKYESIDQQQQQGRPSGMAALSEAFSGEAYNDDSEDDDFQAIPVKYPYTNFQSKINSFNYDGYKKMMCISAEGAHSAMFSKNTNEGVIVSAMSRKNGDISKQGSFETFTHRGKTCRYGKIDEEEEEDDSMVLVIEIPNYDTYITLVSTPPQTKAEMLKVLDELGF